MSIRVDIQYIQRLFNETNVPKVLFGLGLTFATVVGAQMGTIGAVAGAVLYGAGVVKMAPLFVRRSVNYLIEYRSMCTDSLPPFIKTKCNYVHRYSSREEIVEFLYRRLYICYEIATSDKPVTNVATVEKKLDEASHLLKRHIEAITGPEREILVDILHKSQVEALIATAKSHLSFDIGYLSHLSPAYEEIVCRIKPEERANIENRLKTLPDKEKNIQALLKANGNWDAPIYSNPAFPDYNLEAVRLGLLPPADFATIQTYWEVLQAHQHPSGRKAYSIFNADGTVNEEAKKLMLKTFVCEESFMNDEQMEQFYKEMRKLPKLQHTFWIVDNWKVGANDTLYRVMNAFSRVDDARMMVSSLGIFTAFLKVKFGDDAVEPVPVIGLSPWEEIRQHHLENKRVLALHFPGVELLDEADGQYAPWYFFQKHDRYHLFMASCIALWLKKIFVKCYDLTGHTPFVDMDIIQFKIPRDEKYDLNFRFWYQVAQFCYSTKNSHHATIARLLPMYPEIKAGPKEAARDNPYTSQLQEMSEIWQKRLSNNS